MNIFQGLTSETSFRNVYWGPSSNAGGHPMDLHSSEAPLSHPDTLSGQGSAVTTNSRGSAIRTGKPKLGTEPSQTRIDITPIVRTHLFSVFFDAIQPAWPIVTKESLIRYPCTTILEAAILGVAARDHTAIVSWRDIAYIQTVIDAELRSLFNLQDDREHSIQTLEALLLFSLRVELCAKSHHDLQRLLFRISFACQIAQDLNCHLPSEGSSVDDIEDMNLRRTLWAACIFVDTHSSAILGQEMVISMARSQECSFLQATLGLQNPHASSDFILQHGFFFAAVDLMICLRSVLSTGYSVLPKTGLQIHDEVTKLLMEIESHQKYLEMNRSQYTNHEWQCLQMIHSNTHLLFILSLRARAPADERLQQIVTSQLLSVIIQACQTLEWSTAELIQSIPGQLLVTLYSTSRALMVIVDVLRGSESKAALLDPTLRRLQNAAENAREFMRFLSMDQTWGQKWTQAHTLKAIFTRLNQEQNETRRSQHSTVEMESNSEHMTSLQMRPSRNNQMNTPNIEMDFEDHPLNENFWNGLGDGMNLSNVILNPAEWERFFEQYDQEMYGPK
ncbi:hypothetical protein N7493_004445 [Penicillium malachiteum]|uniref:Transcription factor domain-containing protein n=1 Tax=Penicillium malachiteum TaxID=1324776 RepID=A0AAD6MWZ6_9EURO|nr:hypothetical protein N7493_004445 [Penicillium malachiteum]